MSHDGWLPQQKRQNNNRGITGRGVFCVVHAEATHPVLLLEHTHFSSKKKSKILFTLHFTFIVFQVGSALSLQ
jgi:hypothetical protein